MNNVFAEIGYGLKNPHPKFSITVLRRAPKTFELLKRELGKEHITESDIADRENMFGEKGLVPVLAECMAEEFKVSFSCATDKDGNMYVYFPASFPWKYSGQERVVESRDINKMFEEYFPGHPRPAEVQIVNIG